jgi:DNA-binding transcriptional LysR family regulator
LSALRERLPGIQIELGAEQAQVDLSRREADIAIRFRRPQIPDLAVRVIATVQYHLCATPAYLASHSPEEWEFIGYDDSLNDAPQQEWLDAIAGTRPFIIRSNDLNTIAFAARNNAGIAALPDFLAGGLIIDSVPCPVQRKLWMVIHDDVRKSPRVRRTADLLAELFSRPAR